MTIHLAIAFDQNYLAPFYALINSAFQNNKSHKLVVHAIVSGISEEQKTDINLFASNHNAILNYYEIDEQTVKQFVVTSKWTSAVYYRLYFPLLVPNSVTRLLYLDTDTLVLNDLYELYTVDLGSYPVGAVYDNWVKTAPQLGIVAEGEYFNSGVLLIDVQKWNSQKISEKCFEYLSKYPERIKYVDQDALNAVLIQNWKKLEGKNNFMYSLIPEGLSKNQLDFLIKDKVVIHFTLQRPWLLLCKNRFRSLYFHYLKTSPAKNIRPVIDFHWKKVPQLVKVRLHEIYFDSSLLQKTWKFLKGRKQPNE